MYIFTHLCNTEHVRAEYKNMSQLRNMKYKLSCGAERQVSLLAARLGSAHGCFHEKQNLCSVYL